MADVDDVMRRFDERNADKIEGEHEESRRTSMVLFNIQELLQRILAQSCQRACKRLELDVELARGEIVPDHEKRINVVRLEIKADLAAFGLDDEKVQAVFQEEWRDANDDFEPAKRAIHATLTAFAQTEQLTAADFRKRVERWAGT